MGNKICCCLARKPLLDYSELEACELDKTNDTSFKLSLPGCFQKKISKLPKVVR